MKVFIISAALIAVAQGSLIGVGSSVSSRSEDGLGNYKFAYDEKHSTGGSFRQEAGNYGGVVGSYGLSDIDGRRRVVSYVADKLGFRAAIKTNEPGTAPAAAAATSISAPALAIAKVAAPVIAAPVLAAPVVSSYGAPLAYGAPLSGYGAPLAGYGAPLGASYSVGISHSAPLLGKSLW